EAAEQAVDHAARTIPEAVALHVGQDPGPGGIDDVFGFIEKPGRLLRVGNIGLGLESRRHERAPVPPHAGHADGETPTVPGTPPRRFGSEIEHAPPSRLARVVGTALEVLALLAH